MFFERKNTPANKQVEEYLYHCEFVRRLAIRTVKCYRKDLSRFMAETEIKDFQKLTNNQIDMWQANLAIEGKAGKTINNYRDAIVGCLKYLGKHGYNVKIDFDLIVRVEEEQREAVYFTPEEMKKIKETCAGIRELILISLLFDSGMRISELVSLQVENIEGMKIKIIQGKGRKDRVTFMCKPTRGLLDQWLTRNDIAQGYIFPSPAKYGEPLSHQQIRGSINAAIRRAGFRSGSAHSMRHSMITAGIENGADIFTVQTLVGHSDPKTTRRYYHITAKRLGEKHAQFFGKVEPEPA